MLAIGAEELDGAIGENITCPHCGRMHPVEYGEEILKDGTRKLSKTLAFYKCGKKTYIAGIAGKAIIHKATFKNNTVPDGIEQSVTGESLVQYVRDSRQEKTGVMIATKFTAPSIKSGLVMAMSRCHRMDKFNVEFGKYIAKNRIDKMLTNLKNPSYLEKEKDEILDKKVDAQWHRFIQRAFRYFKADEEMAIFLTW